MRRAAARGGLSIWLAYEAEQSQGGGGAEGRRDADWHSDAGQGEAAQRFHPLRSTAFWPCTVARPATFPTRVKKVRHLASPRLASPCLALRLAGGAEWRRTTVSTCTQNQLPLEIWMRADFDSSPARQREWMKGMCASHSCLNRGFAAQFLVSLPLSFHL